MKILRSIVSILLVPLGAASFLGVPSRHLVDKLALPNHVEVPHVAVTETLDDTPTIRALQTIDEACTALEAVMLVVESRRDTCTCAANNDATEFRVSCTICENVQAFNVDLAFTQRMERLYYLYQSFEAYSDYAVAEETFSIFYTGADRTVESISETTIFERDTGISLACEVVLDGAECPCTYETCTINGSPFRGSRVQCPTFTWSECDGDSDEVLFGVEEIDFDICPCLFETPDPEVCNGGTFVPFEPFPSISPFPTLSPIVLPPSTAVPTSGTPPVVQAGVIACTANSDCLSSTDSCIQGLCAPRLGDGELCERDGFDFPDSSDCENFNCGRASGSPESPLICCPGGEVVFIFSNTGFDTYCANLLQGQTCLQDDMCASQSCGADGVCAGDGTTTAPSASTVLNEPTSNPLTSGPSAPPFVTTNLPTTAPPTGEPIASPFPNAALTGPPMSTNFPTVSPVTGNLTAAPSIPESSSGFQTAVPSFSPINMPQETSVVLNNFVLNVTVSPNVTVDDINPNSDDCREQCDFRKTLYRINFNDFTKRPCGAMA